MLLILLLRILNIKTNHIYDEKDFNNIPLLKKEELNADVPILIYVYYSRPNFSCSACRFYNLFLIDVKNIEKRRINHWEDSLLASRFFTFSFPAFIIRFSSKSYHLKFSSFEELQKIVDNKEYEKMQSVKWYLEPNSKLAILYSTSLFIFFIFFKKVYSVFDLIPTTVFSIVFGIIIAFMFFNIVNIFKVPENKEK